MLRLLEERGVPPKPSTATASEFARSVPEELGKDLVAQFTNSYHELRYGGHCEAASRMVELLDKLESRTSTAPEK